MHETLDPGDASAPTGYTGPRLGPSGAATPAIAPGSGANLAGARRSAPRAKGRAAEDAAPPPLPRETPKRKRGRDIFTLIPAATTLTFAGVALLMTPLAADAESTLRETGWVGALVDWMWFVPLLTALTAAIAVGRWFYRTGKRLLEGERPLEVGEVGEWGSPVG